MPHPAHKQKVQRTKRALVALEVARGGQVNALGSGFASGFNPNEQHAAAAASSSSSSSSSSAPATATKALPGTGKSGHGGHGRSLCVNHHGMDLTPCPLPHNPDTTHAEATREQVRAAVEIVCDYLTEAWAKKLMEACGLTEVSGRCCGPVISLYEGALTWPNLRHAGGDEGGGNGGQEARRVGERGRGRPGQGHGADGKQGTRLGREKKSPARRCRHAIRLNLILYDPTRHTAHGTQPMQRFKAEGGSGSGNNGSGGGGSSSSSANKPAAATTATQKKLAQASKGVKSISSFFGKKK